MTTQYLGMCERQHQLFTEWFKEFDERVSRLDITEFEKAARAHAAYHAWAKCADLFKRAIAESLTETLTETMKEKYGR